MMDLELFGQPVHEFISELFSIVGKDDTWARMSWYDLIANEFCHGLCTFVGYCEGFRPGGVHADEGDDVLVTFTGHW
jgi:hypothetical protein